MSRTSNNQFEIMVDFMERNGDLNKPADGPHGRFAAAIKWTELTNILNLDTTGSSKPVEKWKKVWSDYKNNTKRKAAKISRTANGGGPACRRVLTDVEQRVMDLMRTQAATGLSNDVEVEMESTLAADQPNATPSTPSPPPQPQPSTSPQVYVQVEDMEDRSSPFTIEEEERGAVSPSPSRSGASSSARRAGRTRRRRHRADAAANFLAHEERWQNFAAEFAAEHARLRDRELDLQAQWQTLFARFIDVVDNFFNKK